MPIERLFLGGPADGRWLPVERHAYVWRVPILPRAAFLEEGSIGAPYWAGIANYTARRFYSPSWRIILTFMVCDSENWTHIPIGTVLPGDVYGWHLECEPLR